MFVSAGDVVTVAASVAEGDIASEFHQMDVGDSGEFVLVEADKREHALETRREGNWGQVGVAPHRRCRAC